MRTPVVSRLPDFPWDLLAPYGERARAHPDGIVDLSIGTPVDPTPAVVRDALAEAADAPGYPQTYGTAPLRQAVVDWFARRRGVPDLDPAGVLPTIGSKELVAWLPTLLGCGPQSSVMIPTIAYPTYDVGARFAGAQILVADATSAVGPGRVDVVWVNTPSNPTGKVLGVDHLAKTVAWARSKGAIVVSDECYGELGWDGVEVPSILDPRVTGGSPEGVLACYSLSKQSNLAGYRAAFLAGDPALVSELLEVRKHAGMMMPWPVQQAMIAALGDDDHVAEQKHRYLARRVKLKAAVEHAGFQIDDSEAGLYLWATRGEDCWATVSALAEAGILVAPGAFYGQAGRRHVRFALTATDERITAAVSRLAGL